LSVTAGFNAGYIRNMAHGQHRWRFSPAIDARYDLARGMFVPFLLVESRLADGSYEALSRRNPYLHIGHAGPTGTVTDARLGFSGNIADIFTYRVSGGATWLIDYQIFVAQYNVDLSLIGAPAAGDYHAVYSPVMFAPRGTDGMFYTIGAEVGLLPVGGFSATLAANWNRFDLSGDYLRGELPNYDATLSLSYSYKDIFTISAAAQLTGDRTFLNEYDIVPPAGVAAARVSRSSYSVLGPEVNVTAKVEVRARERLWIFVEGRNLANQWLYSINHYRSSHAGVTAGVKMVF
jgi:hypothetical protein